VPVGIHVSNLDDSGQVLTATENVLCHLLELAAAAIGEDATGYRGPGDVVVATIGKQDVDQAVTVDVSQFDLVGPLGRRPNRLGRDVQPCAGKRHGRGGRTRAGRSCGRDARGSCTG
jgi:hypothetical protein